MKEACRAITARNRQENWKGEAFSEINGRHSGVSLALGFPTLTSFMQPSKSVSMESTRAPLAMGCTSCAMEILSAGRNTMEGMPACAQYADRAADVSPAHAETPHQE